MPQFKAERPTFSFSKGLHSDASYANFPPDYSVDELNFELLKDGTRRRRRGLEAESEDLLDVEQPAESPVRTFKWRSVASNPDLNFHCIQIGSTVYFSDDVPEPSSSMRNFTLDLTTLAVDGHADDVGDTIVDMAFGRGHAIITGKYIEPSFIVYDEATDDISATRIEIRERDFQGVEDGYNNQSAPVTASDEYLYNLANQGWDLGDAEIYRTAQSKYPSKNMIHWLGYRREVVSGFNPDDGTRQFSPDKLIKELFQDAPAPRGHFVINPFNTGTVLEVDSDATRNYVGGGWAPGSDDGFLPDSPNDMNLPSAATPTTTTLITATFQNPHFLDVGDTVDLYTQNLGKIGSLSGDGNRWWGIGGEANGQNPTHIVEEVVDDNTIRFYLTLQNDGAGWRNDWPYSYYPRVYAYIGGTVLEIDGTVIEERPTCTAFFAGRAVYSGIQHPSLGTSVYISQVVEVDAQYGKCYQVADPTSENISDIIPTDGLVLRIPEAGRIYALMPYGSSLIIYASGGVWQLGPGASGYFSATSYSVRKISDAQCVNATSVTLAEETPVFWASSGIFAIVQDPNSGFLVSRSITEGVLDTFYSELGEALRRTATGDFDRIQKRIVWVYGQTNALVYDLRFKAFTPWEFGVSVCDIFTTTDINDSQSTLRFIVFAGEAPASVSFDVTIGTNGSTAYGYDSYSLGPGNPDFGSIIVTPPYVDGAQLATIEGFSTGAGFEMFILESLLPEEYTTLRVETSTDIVFLDLENPDDGYLDPAESWYYWDQDVWGVSDLNQIRTITFMSGGTSGGSYQIATASSLTFADFGVDTESYLVTGFDTAQAVSRRKQAPIITVFSKSTEIVTSEAPPELEVVAITGITQDASSEGSRAGPYVFQATGAYPQDLSTLSHSFIDLVDNVASISGKSMAGYGENWIVTGALSTSQFFYAYTHNNGANWTVVKASDNLVLNDNVSGVASNTAGRWVMSGKHTNGTCLVYSDDFGVTWTPSTGVPANFNIDGGGGEIAYLNGLFVVTGDKGIAVSSDGETFSHVLVLGSGGASMSRLNYGNGKYVAVASSFYRTSTDGVTWSSQVNWPSPLDIRRMTAVAFGNGIWVASSAYDSFAGGMSVSSNDMSTWSSPVDPVGASFPSVNDVIFDGTRFIGATRSNTNGSCIVSSTDGVNWTKHAENSVNRAVLRVYALQGEV